MPISGLKVSADLDTFFHVYPRFFPALFSQLYFPTYERAFRSTTTSYFSKSSSILPGVYFSKLYPDGSAHT